ncbi:MAG TPA: MMPL family transporter [Jatrophihabitans sp.]|jgi:RND superfamily putative drug exporter|uniref:MMPL family transporter n=1 Tax=Jatrophihabitans sp. TaxID=1932789 RepID=UPI002F2037CE
MTEVKTRPAPDPAGPKKRQLPRGLPVFAVVAVAILALLGGGAGSSYQSKLVEVQKNDNASFLPGSAESTKVLMESDKFNKVQNVPGFMVFHRESGLTAEDRAAVDKAAGLVARTPGIATDALAPPQVSADGTTIAVFTPLVQKENGQDLRWDLIGEVEEKIVNETSAGLPAGLEAYPAGQSGFLLAFTQAFEGIDSTLLIAALTVVIIILLFVYRSPVLWIFPILSALMALGLSSMVIYFLAKEDVLSLNGQTAGIMPVLVLGAGTDYALLLVARYREELHNYPNRFDAMIVAWRGAVPAIVASAATVMLGLGCLIFSSLESNKTLAPAGVISIACTLLLSITFLPVLLALAGRWVFWPRKPKLDQTVDLTSHGFWGGVASRVDRNRRPAWIGSVVLLGVCLIGLFSLNTSGFSQAETLTNEADAIVGQELYDEKFGVDTNTPAVITTNANSVDAVIAAVSKVEGVDTKPGAVCVQVDYPKLAAAIKSGSTPPPSGSCAPESLQVQPIEGRTILNATMTDAFDTDEAYATVDRLREAVGNVPGADAQVGGISAATLDVKVASEHDRYLIIPIVLLVIFLVLAVLLRSILAPILLILTVVLSFGAALGIGALAFEHLFGFPGSDPSYPLFSFVFLVALGIDYNIFLMTRIREESIKHGTRAGISRGLTVTGGVITSAGIVLAATFTVLGVLPLVFLTELGFTVAVGVLIDTILVRSVLVPALAADIGKKIWWPSKLATAQD